MFTGGLTDLGFDPWAICGFTAQLVVDEEPAGARVLELAGVGGRTALMYACARGSESERARQGGLQCAQRKTWVWHQKARPQVVVHVSIFS